ncbi:hypothetical protein RCS94_09030 [Orbaceae bacterium ac157xtp]
MSYEDTKVVIYFVCAPILITLILLCITIWGAEGTARIIWAVITTLALIGTIASCAIVAYMFALGGMRN